MKPSVDALRRASSTLASNARVLRLLADTRQHESAGELRQRASELESVAQWLDARDVSPQAAGHG